MMDYKVKTQFEAMRDLFEEMGYNYKVIEYGQLYTLLVEITKYGEVVVWTYWQESGNQVKKIQKRRKYYFDKKGNYFNFLGGKVYL